MPDIYDQNITEIPTVDLKRYVYRLEISIVHLKDATKNIINFGQYITDIGIFKHYVEYNLPILKMHLVTDKKIMSLIKTDANYLVFNFNMYIHEEITSTKSYQHYSDTYTQVIKDEKFIMVSAPNSSPNPGQPITNPPESDKMWNFHMQLELFPLNGIENSKEMINRVYPSTTVGSALIATFSNYLHSKLYMQTPHNTKSYHNIFIPPMRLNALVAYIQKHYGIYNNGILYFHDFANKTWLMDRFDRFEKIEKCKNTVVFEIYSPQASSPQVNGTFINKDTKNTHIRTQVEPSYRELGNEQSVLLGEEFHVTGTSQEEYCYTTVVKSKVKTTNSELGRKTTVNYAPGIGANKMQATEQVTNLDSQTTTLFMTLAKIDPTLFNPVYLYKLVYFRQNLKDSRDFILRDVDMLFSKVEPERNMYSGAFNLTFNVEKP